MQTWNSCSSLFDVCDLFDNRRSFDGEVGVLVVVIKLNGHQRPGNLSQHRRTNGKLKALPLRPRIFRASLEGGGEPAHMPLWTIEAQFQLIQIEPTFGSSLFSG